MQKKMSEEKNFENKVKRYLKENNIWYVKYFENGVTKAGIPDILACVNGFFVGIEIKASKGKPSEIQKYQQEQIRKSNGISIILYPDMFEHFKSYVQYLLSICNIVLVGDLNDFD